MIVILDELTPIEFFKHGGIVKIDVDDEIVKLCNVKKKQTIFDYVKYVRFFNGIYLKYVHSNPDSQRDELYKKINSFIKVESFIGTSKYVLDPKYDNVNSFIDSTFYYSGEKVKEADVSPRDPYGIKNVCFSLMEETDDRWDEYAQQRLERGFDDSELWNLDHSIACFILPRLKRFRETAGGYPGYLKNMDEWYSILDQMIEGFELIVNDEINFNKNEEIENKKNKALDLLREYFYALWW